MCRILFVSYTFCIIMHIQAVCKKYTARKLAGYLYHHPILIRVYPRKWVWPNLPHSNSNLFNSHSSFCSIQGIFLLQTNTLVLKFFGKCTKSILQSMCWIWVQSLCILIVYKKYTVVEYDFVGSHRGKKLKVNKLITDTNL